MADVKTHERWLYEQFTDSLRDTLGTLANSKPRLQWSESTQVDASGSAEGLTLSHALKGIADGAIWVQAADESWKSLSKVVLEAAGIDDADAETTRSNYIEFLGQAVSGLCQALSARLKREITSQPSVAVPAGFSSGLRRIDLEIELGAARVQMTIAMTRPVLDSIEPQAPKPEASPAQEPPDGARALDLLYDVELPVSVSFGRAQLALKEIIKLTSGSIVELNRAISEPVEIIVNNCVIARGDVVVVEGNYGVRIQQVVSRQERLRTLT